MPFKQKITPATKKYVNHTDPKDLGPSNQMVWTCKAEVGSSNQATEGPTILRGRKLTFNMSTLSIRRTTTGCPGDTEFDEKRCVDQRDVSRGGCRKESCHHGDRPCLSRRRKESHNETSWGLWEDFCLIGSHGKSSILILFGWLFQIFKYLLFSPLFGETIQVWLIFFKWV